MRGFIPRRLPALLGGDRADELPSEPSNCLRVAVDRLTRRMLDDPEPTTTSAARLTREELADLVGDPVERVKELTARGVLQPDDAGRYSPTRPVTPT